MLTWLLLYPDRNLHENMYFSNNHNVKGEETSMLMPVKETQKDPRHSTEQNVLKEGSLTQSTLKKRIFDQKRRNIVMEGKPKFEQIPEERRKNPVIIHKLRHDWTNMEINSPIAQRLVAHQNNCSLPLGNFQWRKKIFGLGSDLHVWGQALCNAMEEGVRIRTSNLREWIWLDGNKCDMARANQSGLLCYFPTSELQCPQDANSVASGINFTISSPIKVKCESIMKDYEKSEFRAGAVEMLFSKLSPIVIKEGERQLNLVFPGGAPEKLITVHIRWGDKKYESKLQGVNEYINGVKQILNLRGEDENGEAHIFLATEDPKAVKEFTANAPKTWRVYLDQFYYEMLPYRPDDDPYNTVPKTSRELNGVAGLWSLGSLLVAMEANDYVLTTSSNWSRLMNELRKNILNPRQDNLTVVVDLRYGEW
jgi:hypothetical protein